MTVVVTVCNQQHGIPEVLLDRQHGNLRILIDCGTGRKQTAPHDTGFCTQSSAVGTSRLESSILAETPWDCSSAVRETAC